MDIYSKEWFIPLQSGDEKTQAGFYKAHWDDVLRICVKTQGNTPQASDTTSEVLTDFIFTYVHKMTHPGAMRSYVHLMAVRRSLRAKGKIETTSSDVLEFLAAEGKNPEEAACLADMMPQLNKCVGKLTPKAQEVLQLRYGQDLTNQKIGIIVGGSKQYIGKLIRGSLKALRECLDKRGKKQ